MTILSSQHMTIPTLTVCHSQLIHCFIQTQNQYQFPRYLSSCEMYSTNCYHHGYLCNQNSNLIILQTPYLNAIQNQWHYMAMQTIPFSSEVNIFKNTLLYTITSVTGIHENDTNSNTEEFLYNSLSRAMRLAEMLTANSDFKALMICKASLPVLLLPRTDALPFSS